MKKRIGAILLTICMFVGLLPTTVLAAETGYLVTLDYDTNLCTVTVTDRNDSNATVGSGGYLTLGSNDKASAIFEIENIAEGYRIEKVLLNGEDYTVNFITGAYGGMAQSGISEDVTLSVTLEEIPILPVLKSIEVYADETYTEVLSTDLTLTEATRIYVKGTYDDGGEYPEYTARGHMEYTMDGTTWNWTQWGGGYWYFPLNDTFYTDFDPLADSYDFRICIEPDNLYCTGEKLYSEVYHVNGGASASGDSGESDETELHQLTAPTDLKWGTYYYYEGSAVKSVEYPGMASYTVSDSGYDQKIVMKIYEENGDEDIEVWNTGETRFYAGRKPCRTNHDFSLSYTFEKDATYYFTVQAIGDGETTSDSVIVTSSPWTYTKPSEKIAAPGALAWNDTLVATWGSVEAAGGYTIEAYYSADNANATNVDNLNRKVAYVNYNGADGENLSFDVLDWLGTADTGYYYFRMKTVSADITVADHSDWSGLSAAYAYGVDNSGSDDSGDSVPVISDVNWSNGYLRIECDFTEGADTSLVQRLKVEISTNGTDWVSFGEDWSSGTKNIDVAYSAIRYNVPAGAYKKIRFTSEAVSGYSDAYAEFDMDLTITRAEDKNYKAVFTAEETENRYTVTADLGTNSTKLDEGGICSGVIYTYSEENYENYGMDYGTVYFSYYDLDDGTTTVTMENNYLGDPYWYIMYMLSETVSADEALLTEAKTVELTDLSGWKECFPTCEHSWSDWTVTEPTCSAAGSRIRTCSVCGDTESESIDSLPHTYEENVYSSDAEGHWQVCTVCNAPGTVGQHDWNETWQTTETQHWQICDICSAESDKETHDVVVDPYVAPTLTAVGKTEGSHCSTCGLVLVEQETIPVLQEQELGWNNLGSDITYTYGDTREYQNKAINDSENGGELTYTSTNSAVATVDGEGNVTIKGAGTTVITATAAAVENKYVETSASYTLTVNKAALTVTVNDKTIVYGEAPDNNGYTVTGLVNREDESVLKGTASYNYTYEQYGNVGEYEIALSGLTADNYDITFVPGKLTVEKASAYTITLGNLSQKTGSVSAVTAAVEPQDNTAVVLVEYELVTPAVACGHVHEEACGEAGAACIHTEHDEDCGYAEENRTWTTEVPDKKGSYNVRASLTASENITLPAETAYTTGILEIKASATIGGGSSGSSKNDTALDVESGEENVSVDVTVDKGTVEVVLTDEALEEIIEKVPATGEVVVDLTSVDNAEELVLPAELVTALEESEDVKELTVVSEDAEIVMDADVLATLADSISSTNDKVTVRTTAVDSEDLTEQQRNVVDSIATDPVIVELSLVVTHYDDEGNVVGETDLHELNGDVEVRVAYELPEGMEGKHVVVAYVSDDGSVTYIRASYENGYVNFTTDHFSVFMVYASYAASFKDVDLGAWYVPYVEYVVEKGVMAGTSADTFQPDTTTTRGMIVTILYSLAGKPVVTGDAPFTDVAADQYYAKAVAWAAANGIVSGYGDGNFGPEDTITREQMAVILYSYAKYKGMNVSVGEDTNILSYNDAFEISEWAIPAFQWACGEGVLTGTGNGMLSPKTGATRAQVAAILKQFCEG